MPLNRGISFNLKENIYEKTTPEMLKYMVDGIKYVCETYKRRGPGTQSERDAQDFFKKELSKYSDEVISEDFPITHTRLWVLSFTQQHFHLSVLRVTGSVLKA